MARLPLDTHLSWRPGSGKSLTLNQVCSILLDIKLTGDWAYALRHVPRRKVYKAEEGEDFKVESAIDDYLNKAKPEEKFIRSQAPNTRTCVSKDPPKPILKRKVFKKKYLATIFED